MDVAFSLFAYVAPMLAIPVLVGNDHRYRLLAMLLFFGSPLIGEITYLNLQPAANGPIHPLEFGSRVAAFYPMAVLPLGLWAACFGVGAAQIMRRMVRSVIGYPPWLVFLVCLLLAGVGGLAFSLLYGYVGAVAEAVRPAPGQVRATGAAGFAAGVFTGAAALFMSPLLKRRQE